MTDHPDKDPLLDELRDLPAAKLDAPVDARAHRAARAAFVRAFEPEPWHVRAFGSVGRAAVPVGLAAVVGIYLMWAIGTATSLVH